MIRVFGVLFALRVLLLPHTLCGESYSISVGMVTLGLPSGKESACQCRRCRRCSSVPGLERSPGEGNGNSLQYSCWEIPWTEGLGRLLVYGVSKSQTWLSIQSHTHIQRHTFMHSHAHLRLYLYLCLFIMYNENHEFTLCLQFQFNTTKYILIFSLSMFINLFSCIERIGYLCLLISSV